MKIVFELLGNPQVSFSGHPFEGNHQEAPRWRDAHVEGIIVDTPTSLKPKGDALYIEGTLSAVRSACEDLLAQLDSLERLFRSQVEEAVSRAQQCAVCAMWFDSKYNTDGDGRGMSCLGDGTAVMGQRLILVNGIEVSMETIKAGDRFIIKDPINDDERKEFEALEDAFMKAGYFNVRIRRK